MIKNQYAYLEHGAARYTGVADHYVRFAMEHQLMNAETWKNFVKVFTEDSDDWDKGWRCEYWGKMMRGACLTYMYNKDPELYTVLEATVRDLLGTQREDGRFSTYSSEKQLDGWDIWGRKYVLTAMLHFIRICKDEKLKATILQALCRHIDALMEKIGPETEGKLEITKATTHWLGVNSASILDAVLELYQVTGEERFLRFGQYILGTGGIQGEGNLIELALAGELMPYQYPEVKAYETISFFEGVLTYYQLTGEEKYLTAVLKFVEAVNATDITVIGCSGCTHELFDNSALKQTEPAKEAIMQETCVTVTWMRMLAKLHLLTGEKQYFDRMEISAYNALYGSANDNRLDQFSMEERLWVDPLPFDSYSPLYDGPRGVGIGGWKRFRWGGGYGCCACIAAAGVALYPLCAVLRQENGLVLNGLLPGTVDTLTANGQPLQLNIESCMPATPGAKITVKLANSEYFALRVRVPGYYENAVCSVNGEAVPVSACVNLYRTWQDGDVIELTGSYSLQKQVLNGRTAYTYGPLVLALDTKKNPELTSAAEDIALKCAGETPVYTAMAPCEKDSELVRFAFERADGKAPLIMTDYASCGKRWNAKPDHVTVWLNVK